MVADSLNCLPCLVVLRCVLAQFDSPVQLQQLAVEDSHGRIQVKQGQLISLSSAYTAGDVVRACGLPERSPQAANDGCGSAYESLNDRR